MKEELKVLPEFKYEILLGDSKYTIANGAFNHMECRTVYRIRASKSFDVKIGDDKHIHVSAGTIGGYIEHASNLSQYDNSWIFDDAIVCGTSTIHDSAIMNDAYVSSINVLHSVISNNVKINQHYVPEYDNREPSVIFNCNIKGDAYIVMNKSSIGNCNISNQSTINIHRSKILDVNIGNNVTIAGDYIQLHGGRTSDLRKSIITDNVTIKSYTYINCAFYLSDDVLLHCVKISDDKSYINISGIFSMQCPDANILNDIVCDDDGEITVDNINITNRIRSELDYMKLYTGTIYDRADISKPNHIFVSDYVGSNNSQVTFYKSNNPDHPIYVTRGCFHGTLDEFKDAVLKKHDSESVDGKTYLGLIEIAKLRILGE